MAVKIIIPIVMSVLLALANTQDNIRCDMNNRYSTCDPGFCCVRDQFLATYLYCKRIPTTTHHCMTLESESECACAKNLTCIPNINQPTFTSVYGTCQQDPTSGASTTVESTRTFHKPTASHHSKFP